ncbi:MAG: ATP-binding protein [Candidatus Omnitrophota bacterium]
MKIRSIKFKLSILYTVILTVILVIFSGVLYFSLSHLLYEELDNELSIKIREIENTIGAYLKIIGEDNTSFVFAAKRIICLEEGNTEQEKVSEFEGGWLQKRDKLDLELDWILFWSSKGELLASSKNVPSEVKSFLEKHIEIPRDKKVYYKNIILEKQRLRVVNHLFAHDHRGRFLIQVVTSIKPIIDILRNRLYAIMSSIFVIMGVSFFVGRFFVNWILFPVREVVSLARHITYKDLSARVKVKHADEEMEYLVDAFNEMITRLENSFKYIVEFSSHVAHELKTPLTIIRGESELALESKDIPNECRELIHSNLEEISRMIKIVEDLLLLTKLEYRPEIFKFEELEIDPFLKEIFEQAKLLAAKKNISVSLNLPQETRRINADKIHFRRLFYNLIHNAIKFTLKGGAVKITAKYDKIKAYISVSDTGIGIREEDLPKIFDKFFHVNRTGQDLEPCNGLGLSIALHIAKIHRGTIEVRSKLGEGTVFTIIMPLV